MLFEEIIIKNIIDIKFFVFSILKQKAVLIVTVLAGKI